ncbi:hypothetical protein WN55_02726 [Dufourea novaeangliae]|uniref:Uncharacterized protein n=1 Tax=Dufourea novaeangliae TaxID=178035 RepID=A0A154NZ75_DUFNO|nr:hypothetical protein WN55_02726 [Dufourea novaeangliae]
MKSVINEPAGCRATARRENEDSESDYGAYDRGKRKRKREGKRPSNRRECATAQSGI